MAATDYTPNPRNGLYYHIGYTPRQGVYVEVDDNSRPSGYSQVTKYVTLSDNNTYPVWFVSERGFWGCTDLTSMDLPSTIMEIGAKAFNGCSKLE